MKTIYKKALALFLPTVMCVNTQLFAAGLIDKTTQEASSLNTNVVVIREDIPVSQAKMDSNYNELEDQIEEVMPLASGVHWDVSGWSEPEFDPPHQTFRLYGVSTHMDGDTELDTYHYTRTYLGSRMLGDSGRCWGRGRVTAVGRNSVSLDVLNAFIQYVKYGTTDD